MNSQRCGIAKKKRRYPVNDIVSCPAICKIYKDTFRVLRVFRNQQKQRFEIAVVPNEKPPRPIQDVFDSHSQSQKMLLSQSLGLSDNAPPVLKARTFQKATPDDLKRLCLYVSEILNNRLLSFLRYKRHWLVEKPLPATFLLSVVTIYRQRIVNRKPDVGRSVHTQRIKYLLPGYLFQVRTIDSFHSTLQKQNLLPNK